MSSLLSGKVFSPIYLLVGIIILGFILRLYHLTTPLADWHSFRQADTASVAREYVKHGIDLLHPKYHDLSNIQSGQDNLEGYRMVEFPIINAGVAAAYPLISSLIPIQLHIWYRITSILFSIGSLIFLYAIISKLYSQNVALWSALIFAILPYNIYYSRSIFPEIAMVFFYLLSLWSGLHIKNHPKWYWFVLMVLGGAFALLIKPVAAFFLLPLIVPAINSFSKDKQQLIYWIISAIVMGIPLLLWRQWIQQFPSGIPASSWLFNSNAIRFRPAWFRWLFYERLTKLILGYAGVILFVLGFGFLPIHEDKTLSKVAPTRYKFLHWLKHLPFSNWFTISWGLGSMLYLIIFATGNVQHDYYQIPLIPLVSLLVGLGFSYLISKQSIFPKAVGIGLLTITILLSWRQVGGYYQINNWAIVEAGLAVDQLTPVDAKVIAPYMGDTAFLYQTNRTGWPIGHQIDEKIILGADYYVSTTMDDEAKRLKVEYPVIAETPLYILIKLLKD